MLTLAIHPPLTLENPRFRKLPGLRFCGSGSKGLEIWSCRKVYNTGMAKHVIHISEREASTTSVETLLAHVRSGGEVIIENGERAVAVLRSAEPHPGPGRLLSESIALAEAHARESGYEPTLDPDFAADLEEIINSRQPRNLSTWE